MEKKKLLEEHKKTSTTVKKKADGAKISKNRKSVLGKFDEDLDDDDDI